MAEIREYVKEDLPALTALWQEAFGDSEDLISGFFEKLPDMGSFVVASENGEIIAMAGALCGQELQEKASSGAKEVGYIYAVAVKKEYRGLGLGKSITKAAYDLALKREAEIVCLLPASEELYSFYKKNLGFEPVLWRKKRLTPAADSEMTMKLSCTEYNMMRESLLAGQSYLRLSYFSADCLKLLLEASGGGLFASMSGICACSSGNGVCRFYEVISQNPEATAASVAHALGCERAEYYLPCSPDDEEGEKFIAALPGSIPENAVWNIAFE